MLHPKSENELPRRALLKGALALAGGAMASSLLAACAPVAPVAPAASTAAPGAPATSAAGAPTAKPAAAQPRKGGSLIIATGDALVPDLAYGNAFGPQGFTALQWMWPLFRTKPASFEVINALAESYTPSADRL